MSFPKLGPSPDPRIYFLAQETVRPRLGRCAFNGILISTRAGSTVTEDQLKKFFPDLRLWKSLELATSQKVYLRSMHRGTWHPWAQSLAQALQVDADQLRIEFCSMLAPDNPLSKIPEELFVEDREPAVENLLLVSASEVPRLIESFFTVASINETSFDRVEDPSQIGLQFRVEEMQAIRVYEKQRGVGLTRAEWELLAQSWSEHCKHKVFGADIETPQGTFRLFADGLRAPAMSLIQERLMQKNGRVLSAFEDNAGVLQIYDHSGKETDWAVAAKMETHNSPSAISPRAGAATGLVGVHRDILGTGLGATPIANWNVLVVEEPVHQCARPAEALSPELIRLGVLAGIEEGGNQSGVPTLGGSIEFHEKSSAKPYVFAGALGLLRASDAMKRPGPGLKLFVVGGSTGRDGLRGAVMSSRELSDGDRDGSAVQVANAFVQRRLFEAFEDLRKNNLIDVITDNGAGGLASSCGELANLCGGAELDLSQLNLKTTNLESWEKLLSESQERMTVGSRDPQGLKEVLEKWDVPFSEVGQTQNSGRFVVRDGARTLVDVSLEFLFSGCPRMKLKTGLPSISSVNENELFDDALTLDSVPSYFASVHGSSRRRISERFDHEVGGRSSRLPYSGRFESSPSQGCRVEITECKASVALGFSTLLDAEDASGLVGKAVTGVFFEALTSFVLAGGVSKTAAALDNFSWPDPTLPEARSEASLARLVDCCESLRDLALKSRIPFISGKDSVKNNAGSFRCPETLIVSIFGSACAKTFVPSSFFAKANDVLLGWQPLDPAQDGSMESLTNRIALLEQLIAQGLIRSARSARRGGLGVSLCKMSFGSKVGFILDHQVDQDSLFREGWGGFVLALDPHVATQVQALAAGTSRLGVTTAAFAWHDSNGKALSLERFVEAYESRGKTGFFG